MYLYFGSGLRSALAADNLQSMGHTRVYSVNGGATALAEAGRPVTMREQTPTEGAT